MTDLLTGWDDTNEYFEHLTASEKAVLAELTDEQAQRYFLAQASIEDMAAFLSDASTPMKVRSLIDFSAWEHAQGGE